MRYVVEGVPASKLWAFTPGLTRNGIVATRGLTHVIGYPGTEAVKVDRPGLPNPSFSASYPGSAIAPDAIAPDVYVPLADNMGPWSARGAMTTRTGTNELPVPAAGWTPIAAVAAYFNPRRGGRHTIGWPRVAPTFPPLPGTG